MGWSSGDVLRTAALVIAMYLFVKLLWFANTLFLGAFLGTLFGLAVASGVDRLHRFRVPRGLAAFVIVFGFLGLLGLFGAWMAPTLREQGTVLRQRLPQAVDRIENWVDRNQGGFIGMLLGGRAGGAPTQTNAQSPTPTAKSSPTTTASTPRAAGTGDSGARADSAGDSATIDAKADTLASRRPAAQAPPKGGAAGADSGGQAGAPSATSTLKQKLGQQMSGISRYLFPFLTSTIAAVAGIVIIMFLAIYIGAEPELYHRGLMHLFPHGSRARAGEVLTAMATVLRKWLVTQLIAMVVIGVVTTIALLILDVKAAFALGVLAGLLEFIPTVGPILSAIPAVAMAFLDSPEKAITVGLVYLAIQQLENILLIPMLMKGGMDIPPVLTILAQSLLALLFGFLGLMVAVPLLAATMVGVKMLYVEDVVGDQVMERVEGDDEDDEDDEDDR